MENDNKFKPHLCQVSNNMETNLLVQDHSHLGGGGGQGGHAPTSISEPNKVQQFQFQIQEILLFMSVWKLY